MIGDEVGFGDKANIAKVLKCGMAVDVDDEGGRVKLGLYEGGWDRDDDKEGEREDEGDVEGG